jgi:hypothetical protein
MRRSARWLKRGGNRELFLIKKSLNGYQNDDAHRESISQRLMEVMNILPFALCGAQREWLSYKMCC